jgi:hypothetical protein
MLKELNSEQIKFLREYDLTNPEKMCIAAFDIINHHNDVIVSAAYASLEHELRKTANKFRSKAEDAYMLHILKNQISAEEIMARKEEADAAIRDMYDVLNDFLKHIRSVDESSGFAYLKAAICEREKVSAEVICGRNAIIAVLALISYEISLIPLFTKIACRADRVITSVVAPLQNINNLLYEKTCVNVCGVNLFYNYDKTKSSFWIESFRKFTDAQRKLEETVETTFQIAEYNPFED